MISPCQHEWAVLTSARDTKQSLRHRISSGRLWIRREHVESTKCEDLSACDRVVRVDFNDDGAREIDGERPDSRLEI